MHIDSDELRNYATILAAIVALLVFIVNTRSQNRNRRIENIARFNKVHQRLFSENGYLARNLAAIEAGTMHERLVYERLKRERAARGIETQPLLVPEVVDLDPVEVERLAVLANNKAVPRSTQVYLFGSYAPTLLRLMTEEERDSMFWELARGYLEGVARDAERYAKLSRSERAQFWR